MMLILAVGVCPFDRNRELINKPLTYLNLLTMERMSNDLVINGIYEDREGLIFKIIGICKKDCREQDAFVGTCLNRDIQYLDYASNNRIYTKNGGYGITPNHRDLIKRLS